MTFEPLPASRWFSFRGLTAENKSHKVQKLSLNTFGQCANIRGSQKQRTKQTNKYMIDATTIETGVVNLRCFTLRDGYNPREADTPDWVWASSEEGHSCATLPTWGAAKKIIEAAGYVAVDDPPHSHAFHRVGVGLLPTYSGGQHQWWVKGQDAIVGIVSP